MENKYKTFEDFTNQTAVSILGDEYAYIDLDPSTIEEQKFIANTYETSLGHINLIDPVKHIYSVTTEEREGINVIVYSAANANKIKENCFNYFMKGLEDPLKELKYPIIESVGQVNLYAYLATELLEANFKQKFNISRFLTEKCGCKSVPTPNSEYLVYEKI